MLGMSPRRTARRDISIATLLNSRIAVFGHSQEGNSMFCQVGTPRNTMYALVSPANNIMIAVSNIHTPIWPFEIGNEEAGSPLNSPPPPRPSRGGDGGSAIPFRSSTRVGIYPLNASSWPLPAHPVG